MTMCSDRIDSRVNICCTLLCDYTAKALMENKRLIYTSPVKSLSNQKYAELKDKYGEQSVGLATGDNKVPV